MHIATHHSCHIFAPKANRRVRVWQKGTETSHELQKDSRQENNVQTDVSRLAANLFNQLGLNPQPQHSGALVISHSPTRKITQNDSEAYRQKSKGSRCLPSAQGRLLWPHQLCCTWNSAQRLEGR